MTTYVLDTDAVIDVLKGIKSSIELVQLLKHDGGRLATCAVVVAEIHSGIRPQDLPLAEPLLSNLDYLDTTRAAAVQAGVWRYAAARRGLALSISDVLIAATTAAHGAILVTANATHYPMQGLRLLALPRGLSS